ncbi:MAG TPA: N-formylglutamate amidohydrolase [Candidatus Caenarcaniphilales bacterium]
MKQSLCHLIQGNSPLVAAAIHDGHVVREEVAELLALEKHDRFREEDPYTRTWTIVADTRIIGLRSRFEVDLNRPRHQAVYHKPQQAWGLKVWKRQPPAELVACSLAEYDAFYAEVYSLLANLQQRFGHFVVFDLHSYNHRRGRPNAPPADPADNPEVNIGTVSMDRQRWAPVVDRFISDLRRFDFLGRQLDVRENVRFKGGYFPKWVHHKFPESGCALAIEFKKFFMDEWSYEADHAQLKAIYRALQSTVPGVLEELQKL